MRFLALLASSAALTVTASCAFDEGAEQPSDEELGDVVTDGKSDSIATNTDVVSTKLGLDYAGKFGVATLTFARRGSVSLEVAGLSIQKVSDASGAKTYRITNGRMVVRDVTSPLVVEYTFAQQDQANGVLAGGSTVIWPYFCGNLFPCDSRPSDGTTFQLDITGVPAGKRAIYPTAIATDAPAYQIAFAVGDYTTLQLGSTQAGTKVSVSYLPRGEAAARKGTKHLTKAFDWLERNIGPYRFGPEVGSVAAKWGEGAYGGMEHHPFWHVATDAMADEETHVHEAVHGWYGDGIRIKCWEDFVLSEGTTSYLAARTLGQVAGAAAEQDVWQRYQAELDTARSEGDRVAWPTGCNRVDILNDGLFSTFPYMEGAFFYREVAEQIGAAKLDAILAKFYMTHRGKAARMSDMVALIKRESGFDPKALVTKWLR